MNHKIVTAGLIVIGDEILSGRTPDKNINAVAGFLTELGVDLREARIVGDQPDAIIAAVNAMRRAYDHVITTGGIGPTHDDITADAIAVAFIVEIGENRDALKMLSDRYGAGVLNASRRRMARIPAGALLIANSVSAAPGFSLGNVHVLAGVPEIVLAMLRELRPRLGHGRPFEVRTVLVPAGEGAFAGDLAKVQQQFGGVAIGSYPKIVDGGFMVEIVLRSRDSAALDAAASAVKDMLAELSDELTSDPDGRSRP